MIFTVTKEKLGILDLHWAKKGPIQSSYLEFFKNRAARLTEPTDQISTSTNEIDSLAVLINMHNAY